MTKLKQVYNIKKQLITKDIGELGDILKRNSNLNTIDINSDNTIYLESNCGMESIKNNLNEGIKEWLCVDERVIISMIINTLPLNNNSCIIRP